MPTLVPAGAADGCARSPYAARRAHERSTRANSQRNIAHHYDLSNDLFETFLDASLSYSSALFATDRAARRRATR